MAQIDPEAIAARVRDSGVLELFKGESASTYEYYRQNLVGLMSSKQHYIVIPLAYRNPGIIRFTEGRAEIIEGGVVQMTLYLRKELASVKDCEVDAACFLISNEVRNSISIQTCDRSQRFFLVGYLDPARV